MQSPQVTIDQGTLRGSTAKDLKDRIYFTFQGIPYAKPPLGKLRFKAPQPPEKWTGIYDASQHRDICYQRDPIQNGEISGSEDCLFINVYTSTLPRIKGRKKLLPVMFWIHAGDFVHGSGNANEFFPRYLMEENAVVVTFNYRLGLLGFINFEDPSLDIPGNAGFKDQVMALRWVQNNISKFSGDPNKVTIFGESVGAISVHLLVLSPMSKGLFHKAIAQNGSYLSLGARGTKGSKPLVKVMGSKGADDKTIYNSLMDRTVDHVFQVQTQIDTSYKQSGTFIPGEFGIMGFVIEENSTEPFLDEEPEKIISSGKFNQVPFMIGYTTGQGLLVRYAEAEIEDYKLIIPPHFGYDSDSPEKEAVAEKIKSFYYGGENIITPKKTFQLMLDCRFIIGIHATIAGHLRTSKAPIYLFRITGDTERLFVDPVDTDDLEIVAAVCQILSLPVSPTKVATFRLFDLWSLFAKLEDGKPLAENDVVWEPASREELKFMSIKSDFSLEMVSNPDAERVNFWKQLFNESPAGQ